MRDSPAGDIPTRGVEAIDDQLDGHPGRRGDLAVDASAPLAAPRAPAPAPDAETLRRIIARVAGKALPAVGDITPQFASIVMGLAGEIARQDADLRAADARAAELSELADHDPLLAILNRRGFERELARTAAIVERYRTPASIVFVDLNKFKWINDVYGHQAGDEVLAHVARTLSGNVRSSDIVGRLGGDEFAVILVRADREAARIKAERLEAIIATTPIDIGGTTILLTASTGAEEITGRHGLKRSLDQADAAMYRRKAEYHAGDSR
jgi:diguanylate cyclase (GGDEF)-like protein